MLLILALLLTALSTRENVSATTVSFLLEPYDATISPYKVNFFSKVHLFLYFRSFDKQSTGKISEKVFKQIMLGKDDVNESEIEEMLEEYYR